MPHQSRPGNRKAGFTLAELAVSLLILLLLCGGLILPSLRAVSARYRSREAAGMVLGYLRRARWLAVSENMEYAVGLERAPAGDGWRVVLFVRRGTGWTAAEAPISLPGEVRQVSILGPPVKEFNPDGTSVSGSILLVCRDGRAWRLTLTPSTGRARIYREG